MMLLINNKITSLSLAMWDSFSFDQFHRYNEQYINKYSLVLSKEYLIDILQNEYLVVVKELKDDDTYDENPEDKSFLWRLNYPELSSLMVDPKNIYELVDVYMHDTLFNVCIPYNKDYKYLLNSIDEVTIEGNDVIFSGRAIHRIEGYLK